MKHHGKKINDFGLKCNLLMTNDNDEANFKLQQNYENTPMAILAWVIVSIIFVGIENTKKLHNQKYTIVQFT